MAELWFYHLERTSLDQALPELLLKVMERGARALVVSPDEERIRTLDAGLWTYRDDAFLPHGRADDAEPERQPVLLSTEETNVNAASMLFCLDGHDPQAADAFDRVIVMFEAGDESRVQAARALWKRASGQGLGVSYWRQTPEGRWEKKA